MTQRIVFAGPSTNPILQFFYLVVGGLLLIGAVVMGAVILAVVLGLALIAGLVFWARLWWLRRKILRAQGQKRRSRPEGDREIIEVEYTVIEERDERDPGSR